LSERNTGSHSTTSSAHGSADGGTTRYQAHGFHSSLNNGRCSGVLSVSRSGFQFLVDDQVKLSIPLMGAKLKLGGASDRLVFINHPSAPEWSIYTADRSILAHEGLNSMPELAEQLKGARGKRRFNWSVFAVICALVLVVPLMLILNMDFVAGKVAKQVPLEWETKLGESSFAQYQLQQDILENKQAEALLANLTSVLTDQLYAELSAQDLPQQYEFQFYIVNDASLNAFALPGGIVVIHSGLILRASSSDELQGVLAHEISHITLQHGLRNVITSAGIIITAQALLGDASGLLATIASAGPMLINLQYSRKFETQADEAGVDLLVKAGINPVGLVQFFEKMLVEQQTMLDKIEDEKTADLIESASGFLSTHPATEDRIAHIKKIIADQPQGHRNFDVEFSQLQTIVESFIIERDPATATENENENSE
jgi:predicted Zn-dependent protease